MKASLIPLCLLLAAVWLGGVAFIRGAEAGTMRYLYNAPESVLDKRYVYTWKILETALEKTRVKYGPFVMEPAEFMTENRQTFELKHATGKLTVMYLGTTPELEHDLVPVRIPVDKDLEGYCVFLIRKERQPLFDAVRNLADLRQFKYGLGLGWIDVDILRANQFTVVTGSSYDGLFEMAENGRFDVFLRSAVEVIDEYEPRRERMGDLCIETNLALFYPMPMYFWFSANEEGRRLAARAEEGMRQMIADGTYDRIFAEYQNDKIARLDLKHRRIFRIPNPQLGPETPFQDRRLWFDPDTYQLPPG
jgi:ABC-type amino acid transport substrate-binding protein